jgi:hypothetical protein
MISNLILYIIGMILGLIASTMPTFSIWPDSVKTGLTYLFGLLGNLNFLFPVDTLCLVIVFIINFEIYYLSTKIFLKILNYFRGTGKGLDI